MDEDELSFLEQPNYDLSKLTKPQLRGIISVHAPDHLPPVAAKKEELLQVVREQILPRAKAIVSAMRRVRPSAAGITFLDEQSRPSPIKAATSSSPSKELKRRQSPRGRTRTRSSSPPSSPRTPSTKADSRDKPKRRSESVERAAANKTFESPLCALGRLLPSYQDTPKTATIKISDRIGQISNVQQQQQNATGPNKMSLAAMRKLSLAPPNRQVRLNWPALFRILQDVIIFLSGLGLAVSVGLFIRWKYIHPFPYCSDSQQQPRPLSDALLDPLDAFKIINEYCLECPRHGRCSNGRMQCLDGFVRKSGWCLGDQCIPDRKQLELVDKVGKAIMEALSVRAGNVICSSSFYPESAAMATMRESELKGLVGGSVGTSVHKFDHIFKMAIEDLIKEGSDILVRQSESEDGGERLFESLKPKLSFECRLRLSIRAFVVENRRTLFVLLALSLLLAVAYFKLKASQYAKKRSEELINSVFQLLAEQAALHRRDPLTPATVVVDQLRDALFLKFPCDASLWPRVCAAVTANSNVREQALQTHGHYATSWEWIGMDIFSSSASVVPPAPITRPSQSRPQPSSSRDPKGIGLYPNLDL